MGHLRNEWVCGKKVQLTLRGVSHEKILFFLEFRTMENPWVNFKLGNRDVWVSRSDPLRWPIQQWWASTGRSYAPAWMLRLFYISQSEDGISIEETFSEFNRWCYDWSALHMECDDIWWKCIQLFVVHGLTWNQERSAFYSVVNVGPWNLLYVVLKYSSLLDIQWDKQIASIPRLFEFSSLNAQIAWSQMIPHFDQKTLEHAFWYLWSDSVSMYLLDKTVWTEIWIKRCIETYGEAADLLKPFPWKSNIVQHYEFLPFEGNKKADLLKSISHIQCLRKQRKTTIQHALLDAFLQPIPEVYFLIMDYATIQTMSYDAWDPHVPTCFSKPQNAHLIWIV